MSEKSKEGCFLSAEEQTAMKNVINASSLAQAAKACGVGEQSLTKAVAGIAVQRGTVSLIRDYFRKAAGQA